jgi:ParB family chromosome partitioning protein
VPALSRPLVALLPGGGEERLASQGHRPSLRQEGITMTAPATHSVDTSTASPDSTVDPDAAAPSSVGAGTGVRVEDLDPRSLLVDVNVRQDTRLDRTFVASVRDLGVLVPIVAVRTGDGQVRVRFGHRRTLAAIEAARGSVPVVIVADEGSDTASAVDRIVGQYAENEHRTGLSTPEQVGVVAQLAAFGVSAAQIARRTKITRPRVEAALAVAGSEVALDATARGDLDLTEAAVVAEFASDPDAVRALLDAASTGRFAHVAQRLRDDRTRAEQRSAFTADLVDRGVRVVEDGTELRKLTDPDGTTLTVNLHAGCPGHAARVGRAWGRIDPTTGKPVVVDPADPERDGDDPDDELEDDGTGDEDGNDGTVWGEFPTAVWVCTDPDTHGHICRWSTADRGETRPKLADLDPAAAAAARADRRDVIDSNKAWRSAVTVRRNWLRTLLARKTPPKGTVAFVATALASDAETVTRVGGHQLAAELLGCAPFTGYGRNPAVAALITAASDTKAQVIALGLVLAGYEDATHTGSWRRVDPGTARYLGFLTTCGYVLSDVERRATGQDRLPENSADTNGADSTN